MSWVSRTAMFSLIAGGLLSLASAPTSAMEAGWPSYGPNCGTSPPIPFAPTLWLGHFSGGRYAHDITGEKVLDWQDQNVCFTSRRACDRWQRSMRVAYHRIEGYYTCLPIR